MKIKKIEDVTVTEREKELLELAIEGFDLPEIAEKMFITKYGVSAIIFRLTKKLKLKRFSQLIVYVYKYGIPPIGRKKRGD